MTLSCRYTKAVDIIGYERGQAVAAVSLIPDHIGFRILTEKVRWEARTGAGKADACADAFARLQAQAAQIPGPDPDLLQEARQRAVNRANGLRATTPAPRSDAPAALADWPQEGENGGRGPGAGGSPKKAGWSRQRA